MSCTVQFDRFMQFLLQESSDTDRPLKPKLTGILKTPGKRKHFRKHVEFLDRQEGESMRQF